MVISVALAMLAQEDHPSDGGLALEDALEDEACCESWEGGEEAYDEGEEEESGTDEEEEQREFGIYQCLPVDDGPPDFDSGEPETAEEYLRRVR